MLTFEAPMYEIGGVIVFRDHADPSQFYYLAGPPHLTRDHGDPVFSLLTYRNAVSGVATTPLTRNQLGGAFLMVGVDCGLSEERKADIRSQLSSVGSGSGDITLAPVLYTSGKVNIVALDSQQTQAAPDPAHANFVRGVIGTATPSLLQDLRAIFSVALTPDASVLLENAYEQDLSPIGVMYELQFTGLRPALSVKAHAEKKRIYERLQLAFHAGYTSGGAAASAPAVGSTATGNPPRPTTPVGGTPVGGIPPRPPTPVGGTPVGGTPVAVTPVAGTPVAGTPVAGTPVAGTPVAGTPVAGTPIPTPAGVGAPAGGTPVGGTPVGGTPVGGTPVGGTPVGGTPAGGTPVGGTPAGGATPPARPSPQGSTQVALSVDIGYEVTKMIQDETITIEIVRQADGASVDAMQQQALELIKEMITQEFFKPAMSNAVSPAAATGAINQLRPSSGAINQGAAGSGGRVEAGFQLQFKTEEELDTLDVDFSMSTPEQRTHAPNGFFSALLSDTDKTSHIREIDLDDPFFRQIDVAVTSAADFAEYDIQAIKVDLQHGGTVEAPAAAGTIVFTPVAATGGHFVAFPDAGDYSIRHRTTYEFGDSPAIVGQQSTKNVETEWTVEASRALIVHPSDDVALRSVVVEPGVVDWDLIEQIETTLTYTDEPSQFHATQTYLLTSTSQRQEWKLRLTDASKRDYTTTHRWHLKDHRVIDGKPVVGDADHLYVPDPFIDRITVRVDALVNPADVGRVDVELHYQDDDHLLDIHRTVELTGPEFRSQEVSFPLMDVDKRDFTYQATLVKTNGAPEQQTLVRTEKSSVQINEGGLYYPVTVTVLGAIDAAGLAGIQVDLQADPPDGQAVHAESLLFQPGQPPTQSVRLLLRSDRPTTQYSYRTTAFRNVGDPVVSEWTPRTEANLVLQPARLVSG